MSSKCQLFTWIFLKKCYNGRLLQKVLVRARRDKKASSSVLLILSQQPQSSLSSWSVNSKTKLLELLDRRCNTGFPMKKGLRRSLVLWAWDINNTSFLCLSKLELPVLLGSRRFSVCSASTLLQRNKDDDDDDKGKLGVPPESQSDPAVVSEKAGKSNSSGEDDPTKDDFFTQEPAFGSKENKGLGNPERPVFVPEEEDKVLTAEDLSPPTNCCQSGCPNCVWIEYVEKLGKYYTDPSMSREKILKELDTLEDQNIKAFIMMELRTKKLI